MSALSQTKLNVDQIRANDDTTTTPVSIPGLEERFASAWVNFNGQGTVSIRDSYNVSSITDNGVGVYTINLTAPLADANFTFAGDAAGSNGLVRSRDEVIARTTTTVDIATFNSGTGSVFDPIVVSGHIFGGNV